MKGRRLHIIVAVLLAGLWGSFLGLLQTRGDVWFLERVETVLVDLRTLIRGERQPPAAVLIVAIDDETVMQEGRFPVSRSTLARLVDEISALGPAVIGLDILLLDAGNDADDRALAAALARNNAVIAGAAVFGAGKSGAPSLADPAFSDIPVATTFVLPREAFSQAAATGIVNLATDNGGTPRFAPLIFRTSDRIEISFPLQTTSLALGAAPAFTQGEVALADKRIVTDIGQRLPISYYGPRGTIETVSAASALSGKLTEARVRGRIVVIGATVIGSGDVFSTPFDPVLPGVEVVSTVISNMVGADGLVRDRQTRRVDTGIAVLLPIAVVALLAWRASLLGIIAGAAMLLGYLVANAVLFSRGIWLSAALPLAAVLPPAVLFGATQMWVDRRNAKGLARLNDSLQRLQSPVLREWLARDPDFLASPVRQEASIVFIDLSGFTGLSETTSAATMRALLDDFYRLVEQETSSRGGVITSFMGDGAMILFGLPEATPQDPANALSCATSLASISRGWLNEQPITRERRTGIKLGAHCGSIIASRLGGGSQQTITATGDAVNVASRLMDIAAQNGAELAISGDLYRAAVESLPDGGKLEGPIESTVRGRTGTIAVWLWRLARRVNHPPDPAIPQVPSPVLPP